MNINGKPHTSIWYDKTKDAIFYIDQTALPWQLKIKELKTLEDALRAINDMEVRGAPLIGVTAAFGYALKIRAYGLGIKDRSKEEWRKLQLDCYNALLNTRPTAINLKWALDQMISPNPSTLQPFNPSTALLDKALLIREEEITRSKKIGQYGLEIIKAKYNETKQVVNILTHCNAGWLATVDYGTATAPIYMAHEEGIPVHVWVDETRPRNQGAKLTAYELSEHGVPCTVIPDNTGGHLMQNNQVDMVIVGTDRVAANGDVANKIGTYLKALAAKDNDVPFYVAMPFSSYDKDTATGCNIPIEERSAAEVLELEGLGTRDSGLNTIKIAPDGVTAANYGFDITPAKLVTAYITEKGIHKQLNT